MFKRGPQIKHLFPYEQLFSTVVFRLTLLQIETLSYCTEILALAAWALQQLYRCLTFVQCFTRSPKHFHMLSFLT